MLTITINYFKRSAKRIEARKEVIENEKYTGVCTWQTISGTRWFARSRNCSTMENNIDLLLVTIDGP